MPTSKRPLVKGGKGSARQGTADKKESKGKATTKTDETTKAKGAAKGQAKKAEKGERKSSSSSGTAAASRRSSSSGSGSGDSGGNRFRPRDGGGSDFTRRYPPEDVGQLKGSARSELERELNTGRNGMTSSHSNVLMILRNEPCWAGVFARDEFTDQIVKVKAPPWHKEMRPLGEQTGPITDADAARIADWITRIYPEIRPATGTINECLRAVAEANSMHPVRDWLNSLKWDGKPRVDTWLVDFGGAEDSAYTRAVSAMFMIGAVARVMAPGCKVDHTLVIEGKTGKGKSTLLRELVGEQWFLETETDLGSKDFYQMLRGKWVLELAELDSLNRGELSRIKAVLTKRVDTYRSSYGRYSKDYPRQCVFTGTTEEDQYLKDEKGNRRFLPVAVAVKKDIDVPGVVAARAQLWAEAVARFRKGEAWHVTDASLLGLIEDEQEMRRELDPWEASISEVLWGSRYVRQGVQIKDILEKLGIEEAKRGRQEQNRVGRILRKLGWEKRRARVFGALSWDFWPVDPARWRKPGKGGGESGAPAMAEPGK